MSSSPSPTWAVSLSGGSLSCLAYVSFLETLESEYHLKPNLLAGLSGGSIVAPMISAGLSRDEIYEVFSHMTLKNIIGMHLKHFEIVDHHKFTDLFRGLLPIKKFEDLPTPIMIFASDVVGKKTEVLESGDIASAITASCSVYPLFNPVKRLGKMLSDGGYTTYYGAQYIRDRGIEKVIGVDVTGFSEGAVPNFLRSYFQTISAAITTTTRYELEQHPVDMDIRMSFGAPTIFNLKDKKDFVFKLGEQKAHEFGRKLQKLCRDGTC